MGLAPQMVIKVRRYYLTIPWLEWICNNIIWIGKLIQIVLIIMLLCRGSSRLISRIKIWMGVMECKEIWNLLNQVNLVLTSSPLIIIILEIWGSIRGESTQVILPVCIIKPLFLAVHLQLCQEIRIWRIFYRILEPLRT